MISSMTLIIPFLDGDVPRPASYGVYMYTTRVSNHVTDFNARN